MTELSTTLAGLKLKNPLILASGILGETGESLLKVAKAGAGALVTKSIGLEPSSGYANPTVVELEYGLLNAIGLANPGIEEYDKELKIALKSKVPVIGSIFGKTPEEFAELAKRMQGLGAHTLELNLSCPHAKGYGVELGRDAKLVYEVVKKVKSSVKIPVFAKLSNINIIEVAKSAQHAGCDALVAINSAKAMKIDVNLKIPVLSNKTGGYSGPAIKPLGVASVYELAKNVKIPVIGCGGIMTGEDVVEYLLAGASAVQIGSGVYYRGVDIFKKVCTELSCWMKKNKYKKLDEFVGLALSE
ncbi:MAG: dihydroorotate dehydrogenase [Candidatus Thermoplasmatota archaeon]|nr:dihydroorotate dehydrogenase [Candidatus Thermoplasmatota archaeon]